MSALPVITRTPARVVEPAAPPFRLAVEVNPPERPTTEIRQLARRWHEVFVTDNVFGTIRMSPYAFAGRLARDLPGVEPTVVVSCRDRSAEAILSEAVGAVHNGVRSFLVVKGDERSGSTPMATPFDVIERLAALKDALGVDIEIACPGPATVRAAQRRADLGADRMVLGPFLDPATVFPKVAELVVASPLPWHAMVIPPFSARWVDRMQGIGGVEVSAELSARLRDDSWDRAEAWATTTAISAAAHALGAAGAVLMGCSLDTVAGEALDVLRPAP